MTKKEEYQEYLKSDHWKIVREARKEYDGNKCVICGSKDNLNVHHLTYAHRGNEPLQDLITVCEDCHKMIHEHPKKPAWMRASDEKKFSTLFYMTSVQTACLYYLCDFLWEQVVKWVHGDDFERSLEYTREMAKLRDDGKLFGFLESFLKGMKDVWVCEDCYEEQEETVEEERAEDVKDEEEPEVKRECSSATRSLPGRPRYIAQQKAV